MKAGPAGMCVCAAEGPWADGVAVVQLKLMLATVRESGLSGDTLSCAQQALIFLSTARAKLHALQREGGVPYLFPECWICLAALGIAAVLSDTLCAAAAVAAATSEAASEAAAAAATTGSGSGSEAAAAAAAMDLAAALAEDGALPVRGGGKAADGAVSAAAALQEVMPFAVSVPKLIAAFKDGEAMARPAAAVVSGAQDVAPQPNAAEQRMIVKKMQLTLAQVLASAYMVRVALLLPRPPAFQPLPFILLSGSILQSAGRRHRGCRPGSAPLTST